VLRFSTILLALVLVPAPALPAPGAERSHPRMAVTVTVVTPGHDPIPGATIALCPEGKDQECVYRSTGPYGGVRFDELAPIRYVVRAEVSGYVATSVGPLRFDEVSRGKMRIPDIFLLMNPVAVY
jgi:hypothetical protein